MKFSVRATQVFKRDLKRIAKKHPNITSDIAVLAEELSENPMKGSPLGKGCFKVRLRITDLGKGKSGGARVITHFYVEQDTVYLLTMYLKSDGDSIDDNTIKDILNSID